LDGPNRFVVRLSINLEGEAKSPGVADSVAAAAGVHVRRLCEGIGLRPPRPTNRISVDRLRALDAYRWRRWTISQAIGSATARTTWVCRGSTRSTSWRR